MGSGGKNKGAVANAAIAQNNIPVAAEAIGNRRYKAFDEFLYGKGAKDITNAPGIGSMLGIDELARANAFNRHRYGNPANALSGGGSGDFAKQQDALTQENVHHDTATMWQRALEQLRQEANAEGAQAGQFQVDRNRSNLQGTFTAEEQRAARSRSRWANAMGIANVAVGGLSAGLGSGGFRGGK